jgi:hypothetical protein
VERHQLVRRIEEVNHVFLLEAIFLLTHVVCVSMLGFASPGQVNKRMSVLTNLIT